MEIFAGDSKIVLVLEFLFKVLQSNPPQVLVVVLECKVRIIIKGKLAVFQWT